VTQMFKEVIELPTIPFMLANFDGVLGTGFSNRLSVSLPSFPEGC
jgi:hypothetical protein